MAVLKKYNLSGAEIGEVSLEDQLIEVNAHSQMVKDYIVAIRNNARQWSANTKGRKEVNKTGRKPHPQKGQGRSRQGCLAAPQYKGGGIVFGPKPKFDQHVRINRKEKRAAIQTLLAGKIRNQALTVLDASLEKPSTKAVAQFLQKTNLHNTRVLFLGDESNRDFLLSMRNLPKKEFLDVQNLNGYDLALCRAIIVLDGSWDRVVSLLRGDL